MRQWQELKYTNMKNRCIYVYTYVSMYTHTYKGIKRTTYIYEGTRKNIILTRKKKKIREGFM